MPLTDYQSLSEWRHREAHKMEKIRLFNPIRLRGLLHELVPHTIYGEETYAKLSEKVGFSHEILRDWRAGKCLRCKGTIQERLHRGFGDDLFTHGLDRYAFKKRLDSEYRAHGTQDRAAAALGVGYPTFVSWYWQRTEPLMKYHQQIYNKYGPSVFKRMKPPRRT